MDKNLYDVTINSRKGTIKICMWLFPDQDLEHQATLEATRLFNECEVMSIELAL